MSYQSAKRIPLSKQPIFSGGFVDNTQNIDQAPHTSPYARNFRIDGSSVKSRPGHLVHATLTVGSYPKGIGAYQRTAVADDRLIVRHNQAYIPAYLTGGTSATSVVATWNAVADGAFQITIDGVARSITALDFSTDTTMALIATRIQSAIRALTSSTETVVRSTNKFIISSVNVTSSSAITVLTAGASGTDISGAGATAFMDADAGAADEAVTNKITNKLVSITSTGTIAAISTGTLIASDNKMRFVNINDFMYCMNGSDLFGKLDGTTYTNPDTSGTYIKKTVKTLDDFSVTISAQAAHYYDFTIATAAAPDTFDWTQNGTGGATGVAITGAAQSLGTPAISIKRAATTGHKVGDTWRVYTGFKPSFGVIFNSSLFVSGWDKAPNVVFKSVGDKPEEFLASGSDKFTFGEPVTGLSATTEGLFYFTKNTVSVTGVNDITDTSGTISYITRVMNAKEGAINHDSIVEVGMSVLYLTPNNNINKLARGQSIDGFETLELSQRSNRGIDTIMKSLAVDQTASFGYYCPKEGLVKWFVKSLGASFNDVCIIYNVIKDIFLVDTNKYFFDATVMNGKYYALSMVESKVFRDEYSRGDENSPIPFEYRTKEFFIGDPTPKKIIWESRSLVDINELAILTQEIWVDGSLVDSKTIDKTNIPSFTVGGIGTSMIGTESIGTEGPFGSALEDDMHEVVILRTKGNLNVRFKKVQRRWKSLVLAGKVRLKSLTTNIEGLPPIANNLTE